MSILVCPVHAEDPRDCGCPPPPDPKNKPSRFRRGAEEPRAPGPGGFVARYDGRCATCGEEITGGITRLRPDGIGGYEHANEQECG